MGYELRKELRGKSEEYLRGFLYGVWLYSIWKNGEQVVGIMEKPLRVIDKAVKDEIYRLNREKGGEALTSHQTENKVGKSGQLVAHLRRLFNAMDGEPERYSYNGICNDLGRMTGFCACGHPIRYEFILERDDKKKSVIVGSVCISHAPFIRAGTIESIVADLDKLKRQLAEDRRREKEAESKKEVEDLKTEYEKLRLRAVAIYDENRMKEWGKRKFLSHTVFVTATRNPIASKRFKRTSSYLKAYQRIIEELTEALQHPYSDYSEGRSLL